MTQWRKIDAPELPGAGPERRAVGYYRHSEQVQQDQLLQIQQDQVQEWARTHGFSINNINHYQRAIKMFSRWLIRDRHNNDDRLAHLSAQNPAIDRRRVRRPLSPDEFARLLEAVEKGHKRQSLTGPDRVIVYILACYTGFRRNEIGSVTMHSFNFESYPPTLTVEAGYSKRRRTGVMPLRADLAQRSQDWITTKTKLDPTKPLVKITSK